MNETTIIGADLAKNVFQLRLADVIENPEAGIPDLARAICRILLEQIAHLTGRINALKARIAEMSNAAGTPRRLQTMPGVGPITALAVETLLRRWSSSAAGATLQRGSAWCHDSTRRAASSSWADLEDGAARHPAPADHVS